MLPTFTEKFTIKSGKAEQKNPIFLLRDHISPERETIEWKNKMASSECHLSGGNKVFVDVKKFRPLGCSYSAKRGKKMANQNISCENTLPHENGLLFESSG